MKRRDFFKGSSLAFLGTALLSPRDTIAAIAGGSAKKRKTAKNIIFMVSDGMSTGTLSMADMLLQRKEGRACHWMSLYQHNRVIRALMDTASASSLVTDSAAASSSWGGGKRVPNGSLNVNADGTENTPIWKKFKTAGKSAGIVTTVTATHATPAGFCANSKKRSDEPGIAQKYLAAGYDVIMGGGVENFDGSLRKDKLDLLGQFGQKGYSVLRDRKSLMAYNAGTPIIGIFSEGGLPYSLDRSSDSGLTGKIPALAEMTSQAIKQLNQNKNGFVLQVEGGKVDWAAHANDVGGLLYDQLEFDDAVGEAIAFAERDGNTLVILTTDHGNANPGLFSGSKANDNFDKIQRFKHTNNWILNGVDRNTSPASFIEKVEAAQGYAITREEAASVLKHYDTLDEKGLYNPRNLPYKQLAAVQYGYTSVNWGSMDHSGDYVELAAFGPGSELLRPFVKNYELHQYMLAVTGLSTEPAFSGSGI